MNDLDQSPASAGMDHDPDHDQQTSITSASPEALEPHAVRGRPGFSGDDMTRLARLSEEAHLMRPTFGRSRAAYNARVCDMLAACGLQPTANLVLKVGRWGTNADVQADVRQWYATLSREKAGQELNVPPAARRPALDLIEQLFALANQAAQMRLEERLAPLRLAEEHARAQTALMGERLKELERDLASERRQAQQAAELAQGQQDRLQALVQEGRDHLQQVQNQIEQERARSAELTNRLDEITARTLARERDLEREIAATQQALAQAQAKASEQLLQAREAAEADRRTLMLRIDGERQQQNELIKSLSQDLKAARLRIDTLSEQAQTQLRAAEKAQQAHESTQAQLEAARALLRQIHRLIAAHAEGARKPKQVPKGVKGRANGEKGPEGDAPAAVADQGLETLMTEVLSLLSDLRI